MIKETCKECGMTIQAASNDQVDDLRKSMEKHVEEEHANPVAKHKKVLEDSATFIQNILNGKKATRKAAKLLLLRINELAGNVDVDSLPTDEELEKEEPTKTTGKKSAADKQDSKSK